MKLCISIPWRAAMFAVALGCGDGEVDCEFMPCGGDIRGAWRIIGACLRPSGMGFPLCGEGQLVANDYDFSATLTFADDGTFTVSGTKSSSYTWRVPSACFAEGEGCEDLEDKSHPYKSLTCRVETDECMCTATKMDKAAGQGTWATEGTMVALENGSDYPAVGAYCVQDPTLFITIGEETLVLQRQ